MILHIPNKKFNKRLMLTALNKAISTAETVPFDVVAVEDFTTNYTLYQAKVTAYKQALSSSQKSRQFRDLKIKKLKPVVRKIAQYLKVKFADNEKLLLDWGFQLHLGNRSGSVKYSSSPAKNIALFKAVVAKHTADGDASVLKHYDMGSFLSDVTEIEDAHAAFKLARVTYRICAKQEQFVFNTLMVMARKIGRNLKMRDDMQPKDLEAFGFTVLDAKKRVVVEDDPLDLAS